MNLGNWALNSGNSPKCVLAQFSAVTTSASSQIHVHNALNQYGLEPKETNITNGLSWVSVPKNVNECSRLPGWTSTLKDGNRT